MKKFSVGEIVRAHYKSGTYIGKIMEDRGERYLIEVLAVYKHPMQGDIHNPNQVEGVFFHERKALSYREKMNVKKPAVHPFSEEIPEYGESLQAAVEKMKQDLAAKDTAYSSQALQALETLEKSYYEKLYP